MNPAHGSSRKILTALPGTWGIDHLYPGTKLFGKYTWDGMSVLGIFGPEQPNFSTPNFPNLSEHDVSAMYTEALANAKAQGMDILTFAAEYRKTVEMVVGVASRVLERAHQIVKIKKLHTIKDRKAFVSAFSDSWLEYRYGWRILAFDIDALQELIQKLRDGISIRIRAKGRSSTENMIRNSSGVGASLDFKGYGGSGAQFRHSWQDSEYHGVRSHAGVMIESYMRSAVTVDPLLTMYELVPYSFVVDWFFNINKWLTALSPLLDERLLYAYKRVDYYKTRRWQVGPHSDPLWVSKLEGFVPFGTPSSLTLEEVSWSRDPLTSSEQQLTLAYDNNFSSLKAVDALALIFGRLRALRKFSSI